MQLHLIVILAVLDVQPCLAAPDQAAIQRAATSSKRHQAKEIAKERASLNNQLSELRAELQGLLQYAISNDTNCTTMETSLIKSQAFTATVAPKNTTCLFGLDDGDEGKHCVPQHEYGSFGWCWTKKDKSEWGSCGGTCPLIGKPKILGKQIDKAEVLVKNLTFAINKVVGKLHGDNCITVGTVGKGPDNECILPFKYNGITYDGCTDVDSEECDNCKWCYIEVDENGVGVLGSWGECSKTTCSNDVR